VNRAKDGKKVTCVSSVVGRTEKKTIFPFAELSRKKTRDEIETIPQTTEGGKSFVIHWAAKKLLVVMRSLLKQALCTLPQGLK